MKENYEVALKVGKPVATQALKQAKAFVASECPLAGAHIAQGMERLGKDGPASTGIRNPAPDRNLRPRLRPCRLRPATKFENSDNEARERIAP